ncbi:UDP-Glycosyltransferase/glycogen phosphorylase [Eremomyces bilateralis CBS 781.70]|uniref:UDP-Glycosyltransferase/glycogen phosphorylase n=1 Tax=Eremomyces bilateralis CBS 781.70 TaxID=1392243 RepID=A0A6G1FV63_9PEZI|nr:UDP-Glycosyltransferase/glycogen phosphorylase [Eremomyces bilateralis CBS 781.70]KAF1809653.1 UDP-Glycosyltransferase/glycogen phosphorylase [Eremomyces bilateralis CBS 781.70]
MLRRAALVAVLVGLGAILIPLLSPQGQQAPKYHVQGKNNTILFLTNEHAGLCNVLLATAYALLENHPHIQVHFASFPKLERRVRETSAFLTTMKTVPGITFHPLPGPTYTEALLEFRSETSIIHPPGLAGIDTMAPNLPDFISPWAAGEYYNIYKAISETIDQVDPAVIALDTMLAPGFDATREKRRVHALVTPNILADMMPAEQPKYTLFWKYPALGSGFPYPVPWKLIPANIYINFRVIMSFLSAPQVREKRAFLKEKGLENPVDFMGLYHPEVPWITQTLPGAHTPLNIIPRNVVLAGPINLAGTETVSESGAELLAWLQQKPTVLISLGSGFKYTHHDATVMTEAIRQVLLATDVQVLWKMVKLEAYNADFISAAMEEAAGRFRVVKWLDVEPPTLLQSGHIAAFVHHGGAGCYHDGLSGGVPQVILPQWVDLYNFAQLVEDLGIVE